MKIAYSSEPSRTTCHQSTNNEQNILFIEESSVLIQEISSENTNYARSNRENLFSGHFFFCDVNTHSRKSFQILKRIQIYENLRIFKSCVWNACHLCLVTVICVERDMFVYTLKLGVWVFL